MNRPSKLALLDKQVQSAIGVITNTISALEKTTIEYEIEKENISREVEELKFTAEAVDEKINENTKLLVNFKKLLA